MRLLMAGILLLIFASQSLAAPSISGVSGTVADGNEIVISGSSFGSTIPTISLHDTFENGTNGNTISVVADSADVGEWDVINGSIGAARQTYSNAQSVGGSQSMKIDLVNTTVSEGGGGPRRDYADTTSYVVLSFWQYIHTDQNIPGMDSDIGEAPNWKFYAIGDQDDVGTDGWVGSAYSTVCLNSTCQGGGSFGFSRWNDTETPTRVTGDWYSSILTKGTWMRRLAIHEWSTTSGELVNQEIDGSSQVTAFDLLGVTAHASDPWNMLSIPAFARGDTNSEFFIDDVYLAIGANAQARVEVGTGCTGSPADYTTCTNLSISIPTLWAAGSITADMQGGSLAAGAGHLFVIDAAGLASDGYAVTIGAAGGSGSGSTASGSGSISAGSGSFQ